MEENNQNPNTGSKGVFPGSNVPTQGSIKTGPPVRKEAQPNISHHNETAANVESNQPEPQPVEDAKTYARIETKNPDGELSGVMEIDLISFRERGQESRYLSINVLGSDKDGQPADATIFVNSEEDFIKLKRFISQLNWND